MPHKWDAEWGFGEKIYSTCCVCGGVRWRYRTVADYDRICNRDSQMPIIKKWQYEMPTTRTCNAEEVQRD